MGVVVLEVENSGDPGQVEARLEELADPLQAVEVVRAVPAGAPVCAVGLEETPLLVEPQGLWGHTHEVGGDRDAVDPSVSPGRVPVCHPSLDSPIWSCMSSDSDGIRNLPRPPEIREDQVDGEHQDPVDREVVEMLMRTDPFRDLDRLTQQLLGTTARPALMTMDAWRNGDEFVVEFDLPGVSAESIDLDVERNVLTVKAERPGLNGDREMIAAERPRGVFSRQLILGDNLDTGNVAASYNAGVLTVRIPVAAQAKPRKIMIGSDDGDRHAINA
jgi:HSP20 family protein